MFDGALASGDGSRDWDGEAEAGDLLRLRRLFDPLLADPGFSLGVEAVRELQLLARIHDLDDRLPAAVLWRTIRLLIAPRLLLI